MGFTDPTTNIKELYIKENHIVADLGAGTGFYTREAARRVPNGKVYAFEVQKEMVLTLRNTLEREHIKNVECFWADIELPNGTKIANEIIDDAIVSNILFQVDDKVGFAREVARIVKPGGKIMVIDWTDASGLGPHPGHVFNKQKALNLFEGVGFKVDHEFDAGSHHYGIIFIK